MEKPGECGDRGELGGFTMEKMKSCPRAEARPMKSKALHMEMFSLAYWRNANDSPVNSITAMR